MTMTTDHFTSTTKVKINITVMEKYNITEEIVRCGMFIFSLHNGSQWSVLGYLSSPGYSGTLLAVDWFSLVFIVVVNGQS